LAPKRTIHQYPIEIESDRACEEGVRGACILAQLGSGQAQEPEALEQAVRGRDVDGVGIGERPWTCDSFVFRSSTKPRNYRNANLEHTAHTCLFDDDLGRGDACKTTFEFLHKNDLAAWP
jgi:hypothetical protein